MIRVENHGSIMLLRATSDEAYHWLCENTQSDAQWFAPALVVEPRYVAQIVEGARANGLAVR